MSAKASAESALYRAWFRQYQGVGGPGARRMGVADAMADAFDAGMTEREIHSVMDEASKDTEAQRERKYRRSLHRNSLRTQS